MALLEPGRLCRAALLAASLLAAGTPAQTLAGGGPENVALVVNGRSWSSRTIANYYQRLRHIPRVNVIELDWTADNNRIDINTFRQQLLAPIIEQLRQRRLEHVDYLIYSSDFPYEIRFESEKQPDDRFPSGSLTGMTFLFRLALSPGTRLYAESNTNWYAAQELGGRQSATRGFRAAYYWARDGNRVDSPAPGEVTQRYLLSTMLGYTGPRGNTVAEVVAGLQRGAAADGTFPSGTIYYVRNNDVRSTTRDQLGAFEQAVNELGALGVQARIVEGILPTGAPDVQGVMVGARTFDWASSRSTLLPGAIAEHFTSFGAMFHGHEQTPISEWIRHGAAGTSGTVIEPYARHFKFPHPRIHVHYAHGCTLAEAFYQSVGAPFQLLILGDPLCRPWARIPAVVAQGIEPGESVRGTAEFSARVAPARGQAIREVRVYLDGLPGGISKVNQPVRLLTTNFSDGYHELRLVAIEESLIETQGRKIVPLQFANEHPMPECRLKPDQALWNWQTPIVVEASMAGATRIELFHNQRLLASLEGERGELRTTSDQLGSGPVTLDVVAVLPGSSPQRVYAQPLHLEIAWPPTAQ